MTIYIYIYKHTYVPDIGLEVRVFANGPGDLGSIPGRVIPKTQKMVLDASLLNTQHYKVRIKGKVGQSREGVAPSPTPWCSSYRKGSLQVTLDYGRQLYLFILARVCYVIDPTFLVPFFSPSLPLFKWQEFKFSRSAMEYLSLFIYSLFICLITIYLFTYLFSFRTIFDG